MKLLVVGLFGEVLTPGRRYLFPSIFYFGEDSDSDSEDRRQDSEEKRQDSEEQID